ncbi:MAG: hypothetical protein K1X51_00760 [Rhodospirillaceae bacterium]|nr:hypothetical protein [Rhodospirillaceae bacterium]
MTGFEPLPEEDIHAFIDGELAPARARAVADRIAADPALAAKVAAYQTDKSLIASHYGPLLARPVPLAVQRAVRRRPRRVNFTRLAMAASILIAVVAGFGYRILLPGGDVIGNAVAVHSGEVTGRTIVADAARISETLGLTLKLPDLSKAGYTLSEVAVVPGDRGKAVKIAYRSVAGEPFTLYLENSPGRERFEITKRGDVLVCLWQDDVLSTVMVGKMPAAEMLRVASLAYNGLYF